MTTGVLALSSDPLYTQLACLTIANGGEGCGRHDDGGAVLRTYHMLQ